MPLSASFVVSTSPANISGGTESFIGNNADRLRAHTFTANASLTINDPGEIKHILLVGGGGSGGDSTTVVSNPNGLRAGGGGGGEVVILDSVFSWELTGGDDSITTANIVIGAGGEAPTSNNQQSNNGKVTTFGPYSAAGGGGAAQTGASGGGGAGYSGFHSGGSSTASGYQRFGNAGGSSTLNNGGAGGGGAGSGGAAGITSGGDGGSGYTWSVNGLIYAGGGGGGDTNENSPNGSGGAGGTGGGGPGRVNPNGVNGLGGGGGAGGSGGSGTVVILVSDPEVPVPTYSLTANPETIIEGNTSVFTLATGNVSNGVDLYWTVNNITTSDNDFVAVTGNITVQSNAATFNVDTVSGNVTGNETFNVHIRTSSITGNIVESSNTITLQEYVDPGAYPNWATMPTYAQWTNTANLISSGGAETYALQSTSTTPSSLNYSGCKSLPNGNVVLMPGNNTDFYEYSNVTGNIVNTTLTGVTNADMQVQGGALSPYNGNIYCCPNNSTKVIEINPGNYTATAMTVPSFNGYGAIALADGNVIMKPDTSVNHKLFNPRNQGFTATNIPNGNGFLYPPMVQHPKDNLVYMLPYRGPNVAKWDPTSDTYSTITTNGDTPPNGSDAYQDAVIGVDGKIYGTPWNSGDIAIFDIDTSTFTRYDPGGNISGKYGRGALGFDGKIYMFPNSTSDVLSIDTDPDSSSYQDITIHSVSGIFSGDCWGGSVAGDGKIITQTNSTSTLTIQTTGANAINHAFWVSPYQNNE